MLRHAADRDDPEPRHLDRPRPDPEPDTRPGQPTRREEADASGADLSLALIQALNSAWKPGPTPGDEETPGYRTALAPNGLPESTTPTGAVATALADVAPEAAAPTVPLPRGPVTDPSGDPARAPAERPPGAPAPGEPAHDDRPISAPDHPSPAASDPLHRLHLPPQVRAALHLVLDFARAPYVDPADDSAVLRRWPDLTAICVATAFFWFSLTPSLVPRPWYLQGLIGGIAATIGYALGALLSWLFRSVSPWQPGARFRAACWQLYLVISPLAAVTLLSQSAQLQRELRELHELPPTLSWHSMMILLMTMAFCAVALLIARTVRLGTRKLIAGLTRFVPKPVAVVAGLLISAMVTVVGARDVVFDRGVIDVASRIAANTDRGTKDGIVPPDSPLVSGSPDSLVRWEDLGYQGRNFTATAPTAGQIRAVTHRSAIDPIRVYIGQAGREDFTEQARMAVRELERTGAFDRAVLAIAGTTASGWINPTVAEPLEYLHGGDTAIVGAQYSYLPSWVSFLVDRDVAGRATRELVRAVHQAWQERPADDRPKLLVFGESMGVYGVEEAFDGLDDLLERTDGALLVGPPNFSPIWGDLTENRDPGSPVWRPEYQRGEHVRFAQFPERDLRRPEGDWRFPRVVYLQNASDPVVWWSPDLAVQRPEWLREPTGPDVSSQVSWFPLVTFWQTAVDMAMSYGAPAPHGHRYGTNAVEGWSSVAPPHGWTDEDLRRLKAYMEARQAPY